MSKNTVYLLLIISIGFNVGMISTTLFHQSPPPHQGPPPGPNRGEDHRPGHQPNARQLVENHLQGMTRHLDLDPEQQATIRAVLEQYAPELVTLQVEADDASRRLVDAFGAPSFDPEAFRLLTAKASSTRSRVDSLSATMLVAEAAVMTTSQRRKFAEVAPTIHSSQKQRPRPGGPPHRQN
jgi:Spy/CpxP family protein refolding chaperone